MQSASSTRTSTNTAPKPWIAYVASSPPRFVPAADASADVLRARLHEHVPVAIDSDPRLCRKAEGLHARGRHTESDEVVPVAHRARPRVAPRPAEALGRLFVAGAQLFGRERAARGGIAFGVVAQPQLERVEVERVRELVHRALDS